MGFIRDMYITINDEVKRKLTPSKTESLIVPGGCTKYMQVPDLVWNKK